MHGALKNGLVMGHAYHLGIKAASKDGGVRKVKRKIYGFSLERLAKLTARDLRLPHLMSGGILV
ncbi:MAG: hypothetical protein IPI21_18060 [Propionivibrio sp.]|nr:hypothetical protein [Propionivibrio sp.]